MLLRLMIVGKDSNHFSPGDSGQFRATGRQEHARGPPSTGIRPNLRLHRQAGQVCHHQHHQDFRSRTGAARPRAQDGSGRRRRGNQGTDGFSGAGKLRIRTRLSVQQSHPAGTDCGAVTEQDAGYSQRLSRCLPLWQKGQQHRQNEHREQQNQRHTDTQQQADGGGALMR